jgi:hypothetical protein
MKLYPRFLLEGEGGEGGGGSGGFTPSFDGALKADGSFSEGWTAKAFGADYKGPLASAKSFGDVSKMLTDSMTAARQKTEGMIRVPGADAKPEDVAAYRAALGVPEKPEDYAHVLPEGVKDEQLNKEQLSAWKGKLHAQGVPKAAAETIINEYLAEQAATQKATLEQFAKGIELEKVELAKRFPEIDKTVETVKALANRSGIPASLKTAIEKGAFDPLNQAAFWGADALEVMAWAAKATGEDAGGGGGGGKAGGTNMAMAKDIVMNPQNPLNAKYLAGDKETVALVSAGYASGI